VLGIPSGHGQRKAVRILWTIAVFFGATLSLDFAWLVADTLNALMAIPNLISLLLLSPVIVSLTQEYFAPGGEGGN
jgi:alanine or glycine:cation symporter, AGCS family